MNKTCNGLSYEFAGKRYYRCLGDGSIHPIAFVLPVDCPFCKRTIVASHKKVGPFIRKTTIEFYVKDLGAFVTHSEDIESIDHNGVVR